MKALSDSAITGGSPLVDIAMCLALSAGYAVVGAVLLEHFLQSARRRATLSLT
jgi:hypothetical protein